MIKCYTDIDKNLKQDICRQYKSGCDFGTIIKMYPGVEYITIYSILYNMCGFNEQDKLCQTSITGKKILIESDTHVNSIYENLSYIDKGTDFAYVNGCKTFLHGGDFIEGNAKCKKELDLVKQANRFNEVYPVIDGVRTIGIYGNHDYGAIMNNPEVEFILSSRKDIEILGYRKAFINWNGVTVSLTHEIKDYKIYLPSISETILLSFKGHSHIFGVTKVRRDDETIFIPAMCDDPVSIIGSSSTYNRKKKYDFYSTKPGFLIAEMFDDVVVITYYAFEYGDIVRQDEYVKTLKRTIY